MSPQNKLNRQKLARIPKWWRHGRYVTALAPQPSVSFDGSALPLEETVPSHIPIHTSFHQVRLIRRTLFFFFSYTLLIANGVNPQRAAGGLHVDAVLGSTIGQVLRVAFA